MISSSLGTQFPTELVEGFLMWVSIISIIKCLFNFFGVSWLLSNKYLKLKIKIKFDDRFFDKKWFILDNLFIEIIIVKYSSYITILP